MPIGNEIYEIKPIHLQGLILALNKTNKKFGSCMDRNTAILLVSSVNEALKKLDFISARNMVVAPYDFEMTKIYKSFLGSYFGTRGNRKMNADKKKGLPPKKKRETAVVTDKKGQMFLDFG